MAGAVDVPELMAMFRIVADVVLPKDRQRFVRVPSVATGRRQTPTAEPTPAFRAYRQVLVARIEAIEQRDRPLR